MGSPGQLSGRCQDDGTLGAGRRLAGGAMPTRPGGMWPAKFAALCAATCVLFSRTPGSRCESVAKAIQVAERAAAG